MPVGAEVMREMGAGITAGITFDADSTARGPGFNAE